MGDPTSWTRLGAIPQRDAFTSDAKILCWAEVGV